MMQRQLISDSQGSQEALPDEERGRDQWIEPDIPIHHGKGKMQGIGADAEHEQEHLQSRNKDL